MHFSYTHFLLLFFLNILVYSCNFKQNNVDYVNNFDINKEHINNFESYTSSNGQNKSKIVGDSVIRTILENKESYLEFFKKIHVYFYQKNGKSVQNHVQAGYCKFYENLDKRVVLKHNVIVKNNKNEVLRTEELFWDTKNRYYYTTKYFTFVSPSQVLRGYGMRANEDLSQIKTFKTAGSIRVKGGQSKSTQKSPGNQKKRINEQFDF